MAETIETSGVYDIGRRVTTGLIARAMRDAGIDLGPAADSDSVEALAAAMRGALEKGTIAGPQDAVVLGAMASSIGSGDHSLDVLRVLRAVDQGLAELHPHPLPSFWDGEPATLAAAMLRSEDLSEGFDGSIGGVDVLDDIDFSVLGERFAEAGLGSIDDHGVLATPIHRYEQTEDMLAALGMSLDQIGREHDGGPDLDAEDGNGIPERYLSTSPAESMRAIEGRISATGLRAALRESDPAAVNLAADALSFVERHDLHGVEMYWNDYAEPEWGAEELACIAASMAAIGGEEFGFTPAESRREAAEVLGKRLGDWAGRDDLAASLDLESFGRRAAEQTIVAGGNWYADPVAQGRLEQAELWTPGADTPREQSVLWSGEPAQVDQELYGDFDLATEEGFERFVRGVDGTIEAEAVVSTFPAVWGQQVAVRPGEDGRGAWVSLESIRKAAGGAWAAEVWASFKLGDMGAREAAKAFAAGNYAAFEDASGIHGQDALDVVEIIPEYLGRKELARLAQTRPDLFTDALCETHPCLAEARDQVGDMWAVGDGTVTYMTAPQLERYFATEPTLADMREAGSTWRDWVYELEGCGLAESVYGEPMREQFAAEAAARDMDAPVIEAMETEAPSRPNNDGFDH